MRRRSLRVRDRMGLLARIMSGGGAGVIGIGTIGLMRQYLATTGSGELLRVGILASLLIGGSGLTAWGAWRTQVAVALLIPGLWVVTLGWYLLFAPGAWLLNSGVLLQLAAGVLLAVLHDRPVPDCSGATRGVPPSGSP
ncbi:MAG TPA: hypothetical protein VGE07_27525 [Herpetosiphonaceae bacterium]